MYLILWWVEGEDGVMTVLLTLALVRAVHVLLTDALKQVGQLGVGLRLLQVKDGAGPAAAGRFTHVD